MCPSAGDYACEQFDGAEPGNESHCSSNIELAYSGLNYACSGGDSDSAELRQRSTWTDSNRALYTGSGERWRAVADVADTSAIKRVRGFCHESPHFSFAPSFYWWTEVASFFSGRKYMAGISAKIEYEA